MAFDDWRMYQEFGGMVGKRVARGALLVVAIAAICAAIATIATFFYGAFKLLCAVLPYVPTLSQRSFETAATAFAISGLTVSAGVYAAVRQLQGDVTAREGAMVKHTDTFFGPQLRTLEESVSSLTASAEDIGRRLSAIEVRMAVKRQRPDRHSRKP